MKEYFELIFQSPRLLSLQLNITNKCFSKCQSCRKYEWPKVQLGFNQIAGIIEEASSLGCRTFTISGGEPFAHKDIDKIIDFAASYGEVMMFTSLIGARDLESAATKVKKLQVSLDAADSETYKKVRGVDAFETVIRNIEKIQELRSSHLPKVKINCVVSKLNYKQIYKIYTRAKSLNCRIYFYPVHTWSDLMLDKQAWETIEHFQMMPIDTSITNLRDLSPQTEKLAPICIVPKIHAVVDADGYVYPCCRLLDDNNTFNDKRPFTYGHIDNGLRKLLLKGKDFTSAPIRLRQCQECDRYRKLNYEYYEYLKKRELLFI